MASLLRGPTISQRSMAARRMISYGIARTLREFNGSLGLIGVGAGASAVEDLAQCEPNTLEKAGAGEQGIKGKRDQKHAKARRNPPRPDLARSTARLKQPIAVEICSKRAGY